MIVGHSGLRSHAEDNDEMPRTPKHAKIDDGRVQLIDNSSSGPTATLLTVNEVALVLCISVSSVRRLQQARSLPFIKVGGCVRFAPRDLVAYVAKQRVDTLDPNI